MATMTITVDDLTGKELADADVYKHEVTYNGDTYTIDTTKANADKLDAAITDYLSGKKTLPDFAQRAASPSRGTGLAVPVAAEKERRAKVVEEYNNAHPGQNAARYSKTVQAWEASR